MMNANDKHRVLLIHGTGAADDADAGERWWQRESPFWRAMEERLGHAVKMEDVFHWTGENSERSRRQAGLKLLERLLAWERQAQPYHLIGHSHGGSVIWAALREATRRRRNLDHLRGWSTVGTPFLQFRPARIRELLAITAGLVVLLLLIGGLVYELVLETAGFYGNAALIRLLDPEMVDYYMEMWKNDPMPRLGLGFNLTLGTVFMLGLALMVISASAKFIERVTVGREPGLSVRTMQRYGSRWLGLWSGEDEAINALRCSFLEKTPVIPRYLRRGMVFASDRWLRPVHFVLSYLIGPVFNRTLAPLGDGFIWTQLSRSAQGNDRPGCAICNVSVAPVATDDESAYLPLPDYIDDALIQAANDAARTLVPKLRKQLGQSAVSAVGLPSLVADVKSVLTHNEMVHTSYFDHNAILALLTLHVEGGLPAEARKGAADPRLTEWIGSFKQQAQASWTS